MTAILLLLLLAVTSQSKTAAAHVHETKGSSQDKSAIGSGPHMLTR
jgi:methionine-rich copper-binding protein CopC